MVVFTPLRGSTKLSDHCPGSNNVLIGVVTWFHCLPVSLFVCVVARQWWWRFFEVFGQKSQKIIVKIKIFTWNKPGLVLVYEWIYVQSWKAWCLFVFEIWMEKGFVQSNTIGVINNGGISTALANLKIRISGCCEMVKINVYKFIIINAVFKCIQCYINETTLNRFQW